MCTPHTCGAIYTRAAIETDNLLDALVFLNLYKPTCLPVADRHLSICRYVDDDGTYFINNLLRGLHA